MERRAIAVAALLCLLPPAAQLPAHDIITTKITWSREISRIVYKRCLACHREGGTAFSLTAYTEARPWAKAIKEEVLMRRMPPWNAVKGFGEFKNDRGLSQEELELISDWVEGGAPEGNPLAMPKPPDPETPDKAPTATPFAVTGTVVLRQPIDAIGVQAGNMQPGAMLQVVAERPDGRVEPLIWLRQAGHGDAGVYYFKSTLRFPAGTRIETSPAAGTAVLLTRTRK